MTNPISKNHFRDVTKKTQDRQNISKKENKDREFVISFLKAFGDDRCQDVAEEMDYGKNNPKSLKIYKKNMKQSKGIKENRHEYFTRRVKELGLLDKDSDYGGMLGKAVLELSKVFSKQGHSGFSANATRSIFNNLMDEWEKQ